jgi:hypothetical protein
LSFSGSERGLEYDTLSGKFAEFIENEVLPQVAKSIARETRIEVAVLGFKGELPNGTLGAVARDIQFRRRTVVWTNQ